MHPPNRAPRIAMVATRTLPSIGGVEIHVNEVAPRLADAGMEMSVLTTDAGGTLPRIDRIGRARLMRFKAWPAKRDFSFAPGLGRAIRHGGWDLVHIHGYQSLTPPLAMRAAAAAGIPYVVTLHSGSHSSRFRRALMPWQWNALRPLLARAERLIAVSEFEASLFERRLALSPDRFVLIPNGSDIPRPRTEPPPAGGPLIASVGRLERYKGHHRVLGAFPRVLRRMPDARLRIAGAGPEEQRLIRTAARLGVGDRVTIEPVPSGDREAMATLLAQADLVVLMSEYEAQGIVLYEALSLGTPVLVSYGSALREAVDRSIAAGVALGASEDEIAGAMIRELEAPHAAATAGLVTWDECARRLLETYRALLGASAMGPRQATERDLFGRQPVDLPLEEVSS